MSLYDKFKEEYGVEILEIISECLWQDEDIYPVEIHEVHMINITNHTVCGLFLHEGKEIYFSMDIGDRDGTYIHYYGEDYQQTEYARTVWRYEIINSSYSDEKMDYLYKAIEKNKYLQKLISDYSYDMYVTGDSDAIRKSYREKLNKHPYGRNLNIVSETIYENY